MTVQPKDPGRYHTPYQPSSAISQLDRTKPPTGYSPEPTSPLHSAGAKRSSSSMASPIRPPTPPPPPPAVETVAPPSPPSEHPAVDPSRDGSISPENPTPAPPPPAAGPPPPPTATPPPQNPGGSSPPSPPHPPTPPPPPPQSPGDSSPSPPPHPPTPPPPPSADASPPLLRSPPHPSPAPEPPLPPAPASSEARSEQETAESASESGSMTLALALTQQTEDSVPPTPPKASSAEASPTRSPQKESAVTIAKLLSGEDPAAVEADPTAGKVAPPNGTGLLPAAATVTAAGGGGGGGRGRGGVGSKRWLLGGGVPEKVRRAELRRAEIGFRVSCAVFCLVALSVMAADTTTGWSGDSFGRYNEYRYVLAASVVAFTYSGFQLVTEVHYLVTRRHIIRASWRIYFNLAMDQMLAYLLLSASSAALSRNGVWMSRFGGDQFTKLINASASMAFLAFIALGLSSIISAYSVFSLVS